MTVMAGRGERRAYARDGGLLGDILTPEFLDSAAGGSIPLIPAKAAQAHAATGIVLAVAAAIAPANATQQHIVQNVVLTQAHILVVGKAAQAHTATAAALTAASSLAPAKATQQHAAQSIALTQAHTLAVSDATQAHAATLPTLTQAVTLAPTKATQQHAAQNVTVTAGGSGSQSLFTSQVPVLGDNSDGAPGITVGTTLRFATAGSVTAIRFYATATVSGTYTVALWEVTAADPNSSGGTLLVSKTLLVAPTASDWNVVALDTPIAVVPGTLYRAGVFSGAGRYVFAGAFFGLDLVNGDITADADTDNPVGLGNLNQGSFVINAALTYPTNSFNSSNYFADVVFTTGGGDTPLVPAKAAQQHAAQNIVLTQQHTLAAAEAAQAHASQSPALTQAHLLAGAVANAAHGHAVQNVTLTQQHTLLAGKATHAHTAQNVGLSSAGALAPANTSHGHTAQNVTLAQQHTLAVSKAMHGHAAGAPTLAAASTLVPARAVQQHSASTVTLTTQALSLLVGGAVHEHIATLVTLMVPAAVVRPVAGRATARATERRGYADGAGRTATASGGGLR